MIDVAKINYSLLKEEEEFSLIKKISMLDKIIVRAKEELAPHHIAKYCFELSQIVNSYYAHTKILVDDGPTKMTRVALLQKTLETLQKSMQLIGLLWIERM